MIDNETQPEVSKAAADYKTAQLLRRDEQTIRNEAIRHAYREAKARERAARDLWLAAVADAARQAREMAIADALAAYDPSKPNAHDNRIPCVPGRPYMDTLGGAAGVAIAGTTGGALDLFVEHAITINERVVHDQVLWTCEACGIQGASSRPAALG